MPSVILRPTGAAVGGTVGGIASPTVVGAAPQLGDSSDTTYVITSWKQSLFQGNWVDADQESLTINPAWVTSVDAHARLSSSTAGSPTLRWLNDTVSFTHPVLFVDADLAVLGGEGIVEKSATIADLASGTYYSTWTMLEAATYLTGSDVYLHAGNSAGADAAMSIYDVWLEVFYTPAPTVAPPCHLYPRDDDQGVGTGAIWPPPSSGRPGSYY